jgi:hypothetical protein
MIEDIKLSHLRTPYGALPETRYAFLITRCLARTESEAVSKSLDASSVFLGMVNLASKNWNIMGGEQRPNALVSQGPYHFVFNAKKISELGWYNPNFRRQFWRSTMTDGQKFVKISKYIRKSLKKLEDHPLREMLASVLVTMNEGMESHTLSERMIFYWNSIERLFSEKNQKVPYEKIIRRATFVENDTTEARLFLNHLAYMRNDKIHHGRSFDHQHQLLEYTCDLVRRFTFYLINMGDDFNSHSEFLEMAELPNDKAALHRRQLAIERRIRFIDTRAHR